MNRILKALAVSAAVTGTAYLVWSRLLSGERKTRVRLVPPVKEVEIDSLPEDVRKELLAELGEQL